MVLRPPGPRRPAPTPDVTPVVPPIASVLHRLTGNVRTHRPQSHVPFDIPWQNVRRYADIFERESKRYGLDPLLIAAMALIESDSNQVWPPGHARAGQVITRDDGFGDGLSVGIMQVKPRIWQPLVPTADAYDVDGNIRLGAAIMADAIQKHGTWERALALVYFPTDDPNGTTQGGYIACIRSLMAEMRNQTQPTPVPDPDPNPVPPVPSDPLAVIFGGVRAPVTYGFLDDVGLNYYTYGVGHGTSRSTQHTGDDVLVPDETPIYAPAPGVVTCVGWHGNPTWGQGCGYFTDTGNAGPGGPILGIGNLRLMLDANVSVTFGHSSSKLAVKVGDRVKAGQRIGRSGGQNGAHTHLETAVLRKGTYWLMDPVPTLREAMKGTAPLPPEKVYADRIPIPQPQEFDVSATVRADHDGVPVLQRADMQALEVRKPLEQGEDFEAVYQVMGNDRTIYWITTLGSRVPVVGTTSDEWPV